MYPYNGLECVYVEKFYLKMRNYCLVWPVYECLKFFYFTLRKLFDLKKKKYYYVCFFDSAKVEI